MSYEGYEEHLCVKGHKFTVDAYDSTMAYWDAESKATQYAHLCPVCRVKSVWYNMVDETNYAGFPYNNYVELSTEETCECAGCGHRHTKKVATYRIPTPEEIKRYHDDRESYYESQDF